MSNDENTPFAGSSPAMRTIFLPFVVGDNLADFVGCFVGLLFMSCFQLVSNLLL